MPESADLRREVARAAQGLRSPGQECLPRGIVALLDPQQPGLRQEARLPLDRARHLAQQRGPLKRILLGLQAALLTSQ